MCDGVTEVLSGLGSGERARIAALRAQRSFFWLDVSLAQASREDLSEALALPLGALRALPGSGRDAAGSRTVHAEGGCVAFTLSTFGALDEVELRLEDLAATWAAGGGGVPREMLKTTGARLANMRRWVTAEQAIVQRAAVEIGGLDGFAADDEEQYFDRLEAKADRLAASIDAAADAMGMLLDLLLNERAYQVSVVATIFVPLTFVTGFFGMNFGWMVQHIDSPLAFWLLGMAVPIAMAGLLWHFLVRRFLVDEDRSAGRR